MNGKRDTGAGDLGVSEPDRLAGERPGAQRPTRIKLLGNFVAPEQLCREWDRMSQGRLRWNDIEVTWEDRDVDFYVIINAPRPGDHYVPARTIVFQMEPWCGGAHQNWGVKTWGEWARPDPSRFLQVRTHRTHLNNAFWQLKATYDELRTRPIEKSRLLASICSPKYFDPGHIKRVDFLKFLERTNDDIVRVDVYAHDNPLGFTSWAGPHPPGEKDAALLPYRYFFAAENNLEINFVTEKLWEPLLTETLCFYWGCPNAADWIDSRAFIPVDLDDFERAFQTMRTAILANEWERRLDVIRREKQKVLEHYQFFPTLERILQHEFKLPPHPTDAEVAYHKHFHDASGGPSSICLVMIARDEAHIVSEALASIFPHIADFVVVDTGSTDGTQDAIREFFAARGLGGHVFERPWRDFGSNRTEALALAREHSASDYLWMLDADDVVEGHPDLAGLTADGYQVRLGPGIEYWRPQIFRRSLPWRYVGVLHEYLACDAPDTRIERLEGDYRILSRRLGNRSRDPRKYERDAAMLEEALAREPENARHAFYLAQSWFDAEQYDKALEACRARTLMGGWAEEVFYSRYRAAMSLERLGRSYEAVRAAYEACFREHPHRAEPLVRAATLSRAADRWPEAYVLARRAAQVPKPGADALFVETADYEWRAFDEQAIAAFYCGFPEESFALCTELLDHREIADGDRRRIETNRDFSVPRLKDAFLRHDTELVARLAARPAAANPRVTITVTSCRRLDLFIGTVRSFLNACADIELVDRFVCVDDNSSADDRDEMRRLFPFFEFIFKGPEDRGHARSLNLIRDLVRTPWLVHLEDDWHFFARRPYIGPALEILEEDPDVGQVLFNRNYAETLEDRDIPGGFARRTAGHGHRYIVHEHYPARSDELRRFQERHGRRSNAWWPHYSLRPAVVRTSVFEQIGPFDENAAGFEQEYARRYAGAGLRSAYFDGVFALHTGRLTTERGEGARANAYDLNGVTQFGAVAPAPAPAPAPALPASGRPRCRVKLFGNWAPSPDLRAAFERQGRERGRWDEVELTTDDDADYFALFNHPGAWGEAFVPARTILFQLEPPHAVARWGEWSAPDPRHFLQVRSHDRFPNAGEWHLGRSWSALRDEAVTKTRGLSAIVSSKLQDPGQAARIAFLRWLEAHQTPVDVYGYDNIHGLRGHLGSLPPRDKTGGLLPYRYTIAVENSEHPNYYTEKVLDALLAECLPFYWGCPNLDDYVDPHAFIRLPLEDLEASRHIVEEAIANDEWSRRIEAIRREKRRILDELQFFPVLARIVRGHRFAGQLGVKVINLERRPDRLETFRSRLADVASGEFCARLQRVCAVDGRALAMTPGIRHTFRGNDFRYRQGIVGCALSHLALWQELAAGEAPAYLIFEDDVTPCHGFEGQLIELCGALEERHPAFDMLLLGSFDWQPRPEDDFDATRRAAHPRRFEGARFLGGTFAYIVSRRGAQRLLALVERDGIQNGIDTFVQRKEAELELLVATPHIARAPLAPPGSGLDSDIQNDFEALAG